MEILKDWGEVWLIIKDIFPVLLGGLSGFFIWYWNNKRTKAQQISDEVDKDIKVEDKGSKEILNMKDIMILFQDQFKKELIDKNETINRLSDMVEQLQIKIVQLTKDIQSLNDKMDSKEDEIIEMVNKCNNKRKAGEVCLVLQHLKKNKDK